MRVLLLGSGGREHAIGWKLAQSPQLSELISAPGNPGLEQFGPVAPDVDIHDPAAVVELAVSRRSDLVVVGPEAPLAAGVVDALTDSGIPAAGPPAAAARLESSKAYAKEVMTRAGVPTAAGRAYTDADAAYDALGSSPGPYVVKADGLAAGKGVLVTEDRREARRWVALCLEGHFGAAGTTVVIEEFLAGPELSVIALCDGTTALALPPARDYKRLRDDDQGPNTGGMGCFSPVDLPRNLVDDTIARVVGPVIAALSAEGVVYRGFLYAGLVLTAGGPKVLEFNCRLGDPETQVILPRLDEDLLELLMAAATGKLPDRPLREHDVAAVDVVLAAPGYPEDVQTGGAIAGLTRAEALEGVHVFHAGTRSTGDGVVTSGGRVLNVVGIGADRDTARDRAYGAATTIQFDGKQLRSDIGL